jgi:hypothetical protein
LIERESQMDNAMETSGMRLFAAGCVGENSSGVKVGSFWITPMQLCKKHAVALDYF